MITIRPCFAARTTRTLRASWVLLSCLAGPVAAAQAGAAAGDAAVQHWMEQLTTKDVDARVAAARGLGLTGATARAAVEPLVRALQDDSAAVRAEAATALARMGRARAAAAAPLAQQLAHETDDTVIAAVSHALRSFGFDAALAVADLVAALEAPSPTARRAAALTLGAAGTRWPVALDTLERVLLHDDDAGVRRAARRALVRLGRAPGEDLALLIEALDAGPPAVRVRAAALLGSLDTAPTDVTLRLAELATGVGVDDELRRSATDALDDLGVAATSDELMQTLLFALRTGEAGQRKTAARLLGSTAAHGDVAMAALLVAFALDQHRAVRTAARGALTEVARRDTATLLDLAVALRTGNETVRSAAATVLARLPDHAGPAGPSLAWALTHDPSPRVREAVAEALGRLPACAAVALPGLIASVHDDPAPPARAAAARALGLLGDDGDAVKAALTAAQRDRSQDVRKAASTALDRLSAPAPPSR